MDHSVYLISPRELSVVQYSQYRPLPGTSLEAEFVLIALCYQRGRAKRLTMLINYCDCHCHIGRIASIKFWPSVTEWKFQSEGAAAAAATSNSLHINCKHLLSMSQCREWHSLPLISFILHVQVSTSQAESARVLFV